MCHGALFSLRAMAVDIFNGLLSEDVSIQAAYVDYCETRTDALAYLIREKGGMTEEELQEQVDLLHLQDAWIAEEPLEEDDDEEEEWIRLCAPIDGTHYLITEASASGSREFAETSSVILDAISQVAIGKDARFLLVNENDGTVSSYSEASVADTPFDVIYTIEDALSGTSEPVNIDIIKLENTKTSVVIGIDITDQLTEMDSEYRAYLVERYDDVLSGILFSTLHLFLIFVAIAFVGVRYTLLALKEKDKEYGQFRAVLLRLIATSCILVFLISFVLQTLLDTTALMKQESLRGNEAVEAIETLQEKQEHLENWYGQSNLVKCTLAAEIVRNSPTELTRADMKKISQLLKVRYTYRFDRSGTVTVTDSPYDHFSLSHDPTSQSYAFRPLLEGKESYVQNFMNDDVSGEYLQYVGVSLRDQRDLAGVSALDGGFLVLATPRGEELKDRWFVAIFLALIIGACLCLISLIALFRYRRYQKEEQDHISAEAITEPEEDTSKKETKEEASGLEKEEDANEWGLFSTVSSLLNKNGKDQKMFEQRWNEKKDDPDCQTTEAMIFGTVKQLLLLMSIYVVAALIINGVSGGGSSNGSTRWTLLNYLFYGKWEKGFNIFSITMCGLIICVSITCIATLNRILYQVARLASTRGETICILLRSSTKYVAFVIIIYFCTAQFVDNAAVLFATLGASSIVIGIGAQSLIGDILAGLFLVFDDVFRVGDMLNVDGWIGVVTAIGIRITTITSFSDAKIYNNSDLKKIINMNKGVARAMVKVSLAYQEDLKKVEALLEQELQNWESRIPGATRPPYYSGVDSLGYNAVVIRVACYVDNYYRWSAARALNRELKLLFDQHGIHTTYMEEASYLDFFGTKNK